MHVAGVEIAIAVVAPRRRGEQADALVMADHLGAHARARRCFADAHQRPPAGFQRRSSRAFETTLTLEKAMAAPAMIGLSRPNAASGMPPVL